jgi:hypothetical protein
MVTGASFVCLATSIDGESLQSSKGLLYVKVDKDASCCGYYQATTGNLEHGKHVKEAPLQFLANHVGTQPASTSTTLDEEGNAWHSVLQISSQ